MKVKLYNDFDLLRNEYIENHNTWRIEEAILSSFKSRDLKKEIEILKKDYLELKIPYIEQVTILKQKGITELEKYFIERIEYYFKGGEELDIHKVNLIDRFERFYKTQYLNTRKNAKYSSFDVNSVPIIEVLSNYMRVPQNLNRNILCPLHKEKTGSFKIYKNTNSWFCFGCHKGGNIINFVSEIENISKKEAYKKLATLYSNNK